MKRIGFISIICLGVFLSGCKTSREGMSTGKANTKALREFVASMQEQALHFLLQSTHFLILTLPCYDCYRSVFCCR